MALVPLLGIVTSTLVVSGGQGPCPQVEAGAPVPFCRLSDISRRVPDGLLPIYPPVMQQGGVSGAVEVEAVVDSTGHVVPPSYRVLSVSSPVFEPTVRRAVLAQVFPIPIHAGRPVSARIVLRVEFLENPEQDRSPSTPILEYATTVSGYHIRVGRTAVAKTLPTPAISARDSADVLRIALLAQQLPPSLETARALCISVAGRPPATVALVELRRRRPGAVASKNCPRSYATWVHLSPNRLPKGYLEPDVLSLVVSEVWTKDWVVVAIRVGRGLSGRSYSCDVVRSSGAAEWQFEGCRDYRSWVS